VSKDAAIFPVSVLVGKSAPRPTPAWITVANLGPKVYSPPLLCSLNLLGHLAFERAIDGPRLAVLAKAIGSLDGTPAAAAMAYGELLTH
jgi:hypothetical protein